MNTTGKIQNKGQVTIPTAVRRQAGLSKGDLVNFAFQRGKIIITPKLVIDRSRFSSADEYTPEQRRIIDADITEGRKGPYYGPFKNGAEIEAFIKNRMNVPLSQLAIEQLAAALLPVQKGLHQANLARNLGHPSLHAKKVRRSRVPLAGPRQP